MSARRDLERSFRGFVAAGSGLESQRVIPGNERFGAYEDDGGAVFATVLLLSDERGGQIPSSYSAEGQEGGLCEIVRLGRCATFSVQWYRKGAAEVADKFGLWVFSELGVLHALREEFRIRRVGGLRKLDALISDNFEERVQVDVEVDYFQDAVYDVGVVENVPVEIRE